MFSKLYEGNDIIAGVFAPEKDPEVFVVSFPAALGKRYKLGSDGVEWNDYAKGFGEPLFIEHEINSVCIIGKWNHWWHTPEMMDVVELIKKLPSYQSAKRRICYGTSMGSYGVLKFANVLNADAMIIAGPRLNPSEPNEESPYYQLQRDDALWDVRESLSSFKGELHCFYDSKFPRDQDEFDQIADHVRTHGYDLPYSGHACLRRLRKLGVLSEIILALLHNEDINDRINEANRLCHWAHGDNTLRRLELALEQGEDVEKYRDLALCFEEIDPRIARVFVEKAIDLRPTGKYIQSILQRLTASNDG